MLGTEHARGLLCASHSLFKKTGAVGLRGTARPVNHAPIICGQVPTRAGPLVQRSRWTTGDLSLLSLRTHSLLDTLRPETGCRRDGGSPILTWRRRPRARPGCAGPARGAPRAGLPVPGRCVLAGRLAWEPGGTVVPHAPPTASTATVRARPLGAHGAAFVRRCGRRFRRSTVAPLARVLLATCSEVVRGRSRGASSAACLSSFLSPCRPYRLSP